LVALEVRRLSVARRAFPDAKVTGRPDHRERERPAVFASALTPLPPHLKKSHRPCCWFQILMFLTVFMILRSVDLSRPERTGLRVSFRCFFLAISQL